MPETQTLEPQLAPQLIEEIEALVGTSEYILKQFPDATLGRSVAEANLEQVMLAQEALTTSDPIRVVKATSESNIALNGVVVVADDLNLKPIILGRLSSARERLYSIVGEYPEPPEEFWAHNMIKENQTRAQADRSWQEIDPDTASAVEQSVSSKIDLAKVSFGLTDAPDINQARHKLTEKLTEITGLDIANCYLTPQESLEMWGKLQGETKKDVIAGKIEAFINGDRINPNTAIRLAAAAVAVASLTVAQQANHSSSVVQGRSTHKVEKVKPTYGKQSTLINQEISSNSPEGVAVHNAEVSSPESRPAPNNKIYWVGDSLSVGMSKGKLASDLAAKGYDLLNVQATVGDSVADALPKVQANADQLSQAGTVVVELGTNDCELSGLPVCEPTPEFEGQIESMYSLVKRYAPDAKIYWVNMYTTKGPQYQSINDAISAQSNKLGFQVIDWAAEAKNNTGSYSFDPELGVHQVSENGYVNMAKFVTSQMENAPAPVEPTVIRKEQQPTTPTTTTTTPTTTSPTQSNSRAAKVSTKQSTTVKPAPQPNVSSAHEANTPTTTKTTTTTTTTVPTPEAAPTPPVDPAQVVFNHLIAAGYSPGGAAGIAGNGWFESGDNPERLEGSVYGSQTPASALTPYETTSPNVGWGFYQETPPDGFLEWCKQTARDPNDVIAQTDYVLADIAGTPLEALLKEPNISPEDAARAVELQFERPQGSNYPYIGDVSGDAATSLGQRQNYARTLFSEYSQVLAQAQQNNKSVASTTTTIPTSGSVDPLRKPRS